MFLFVIFVDVPPVSSQILIGQTAGITGAVASGVKEATLGATIYIDAVNKKGGVNGQRIELISLDDKFQPAEAAANAKILIEQRGVIALFLSRGTPHTEAMLPISEQAGVAIVAPQTGARILHEPVRRTVFNVRSSYQREAELAVSFLSRMGHRKFAAVYADDSFGNDGLSGFNSGLKAISLSAVALEKYDRSKPNFEPIVAKLKSIAVDAIVLISSAAHAAEAVAKLRDAGVNSQIATLSNNASGGFVTQLGKHAAGVIVTQVFPNERHLGLPIVKELHELARQSGVSEVTGQMLEGFASAKVLVEGLRRAGANPTRASLIAALDSMTKFDLGGLELGYSKADHTGLDFADLSIISKDGKFRR